MRSEGFSLGVETCSLDAAFASATVRNRSQPFATVRARPKWGQHGRASGKFCKMWSLLEVSNVVSPGFAWQVPTCFTTCRKSSCVTGAILLRRFHPQDELYFSWQAQHFGDPHGHFAWHGQYLVPIRCVWNVMMRGKGGIFGHSIHYYTLYTLHYT